MGRECGGGVGRAVLGWAADDATILLPPSRSGVTEDVDQDLTQDIRERTSPGPSARTFFEESDETGGQAAAWRIGRPHGIDAQRLEMPRGQYLDHPSLRDVVSGQEIRSHRKPEPGSRKTIKRNGIVDDQSRDEIDSVGGSALGGEYRFVPHRFQLQPIPVRKVDRAAWPCPRGNIAWGGAESAADFEQLFRFEGAVLQPAHPDGDIYAVAYEIAAQVREVEG